VILTPKGCNRIKKSLECFKNYIFGTWHSSPYAPFGFSLFAPGIALRMFSCDQCFGLF
jgi:hypothetical protein